MSLTTISEVSRRFEVSTRTLRYYEQVGLLISVKPEGSAYRAYDETAITRLGQILLLKNLKLPLKVIGELLTRGEVSDALCALQARARELDDEIAALSHLRAVLGALTERLTVLRAKKLCEVLNDDQRLGALLQTLSAQNKRQEETTMEKLEQASHAAMKLTNVRIVYLPPATVAAAHFIGESPEQEVHAQINRFVLESGLCGKKPDLRQFGFNHPNPPTDPAQGTAYGYEMWVTIPDDLEVPAPLIKKQFKGGHYAAHMIPMGAFEQWNLLFEWAHNNPDYAPDFSPEGDEVMYGALEEQLNYRTRVLESLSQEEMQLDLLLPVKKRGS